jgi:signal transduction histidine kinase
VHYTPAGGRVAVSVERNRRCVSIVVSDTGIGIAPDHLDRVFDRFWRADRARSPSDGGVGLGLAIVRALAERNGGRIGVQSTLGAGSRFTVVFPATAVPR